MKELETKLREIIGTLAESSNPVELKLGTDLFDELGLDSMHALEIILEVEEIFGISVQDSALEHIRTLEDILKIFPLKKELHIEIKSNELFNKNIINQINGRNL